MNIRIAGVVDDSIVDGSGIRMTVFVQGCPHRCAGCHNPETHDISGGRDVDAAEIIDQMLDNVLLDGVTLSGGEPFCQCAPCTEIAKAAHAAGLNVWSYTGYTFEELLNGGEDMRKLLENVDVLVDGRFQLAQRTLEFKWRGSFNQRLIDVPASLKAGRAIEIEA